MRLFYAVPVPTELTRELAQAQRALKGNWRSVRADQMHITLAFLPDVQPADLEHLREVGREAARDFPAFTARLRGTGYFPNEGSPRVWFVKVDAPEIDELAQRVRSALRVPQDDKPFKAHVTLARKKGPAPRVAPLVYDLAWEVKGFTLMKSTLHKTGPEYEVTSRFKLTQPARRAEEDAGAPPEEANHG